MDTGPIAFFAAMYARPYLSVNSRASRAGRCFDFDLRRRPSRRDDTALFFGRAAVASPAVPPVLASSRVLGTGASRLCLAASVRRPPNAFEAASRFARRFARRMSSTASVDDGSDAHLRERGPGSRHPRGDARVEREPRRADGLAQGVRAREVGVHGHGERGEEGVEGEGAAHVDEDEGEEDPRGVGRGRRSGTSPTRARRAGARSTERRWRGRRGRASGTRGSGEARRRRPRGRRSRPRGRRRARGARRRLRATWAGATVAGAATVRDPSRRDARATRRGKATRRRAWTPRRAERPTRRGDVAARARGRAPRASRPTSSRRASGPTGAARRACARRVGTSPSHLPRPGLDFRGPESPSAARFWRERAASSRDG